MRFLRRPRHGSTSAPGSGGGGGIIASGSFQVANGQIYTPFGKPFHGYGCAVWDNNLFGSSHVGDVITGGATLAATIRSALPGMNLCRVASLTQAVGFRDPATFAPFINNMTAAGVVCVIENHDPNHSVYTGAALMTDTTWYKNCATYYASNPLVLFQSMNEPGGGAGMSAQMQAEYAAVRAGGNTGTFFCEAGVGAAGGYVGPVQFDSTTVFPTMHNIAWDYHTYSNSGATLKSVAQCLADQATMIAEFQAIQSADGVMPVVSLEWRGNSVGGSVLDAGGDNETTANFTNTSLAGFSAWLWQTATLGTTVDGMTNSDGLTLNSWGASIATLISAGTIPGHGPVGP